MEKAGKLEENIAPKIESAKYLVMGNVDAGKSSFVGVMEKQVLDDGNGYARSLITNIKHEVNTGRTSTHSPHYIIKNNEITTLIDLCGHEKYLKTTMFGVTGLFADYGIVMVGSNMGVCGMTSEHISLLYSNKFTFIVIVTKIDICPENKMQETKKELDKIARKCKKETIYFEADEECVNSSYIKESHQVIIEAFQERKLTIMPVIMVSNKTGHNVNFVRELLTTIKSVAYLQTKQLIVPNPDANKYPMIMFIDSTYSVTGIGIVLSGTVKYGKIVNKQKLFIGPINNTFINITVKSLHNCISENVDELKENETGSIAIRLDAKGSFTREMFSKGQVVTDNMDFALKHTCYTYNCDVAIFNHSTTIQNNYQTVIHCGTIRQTGKFIIENNVTLRANSKKNINVKFMQRPEFILPGTLFMFREGKTKGMGRILSGTPYVNDSAESNIKYRNGNKRADRRRANKEFQKKKATSSK